MRYDNAADGGAGSWTATAADLCRLMAAVDGLPNRPEILAPASIAQMDSVAFPAVSSTQGHGWDRSTATQVRKGGSIGFGAPRGLWNISSNKTVQRNLAKAAGWLF